MHGSVTYYFNRPIGGTVREDDRTAIWRIEQATFNFLSDGQTPPNYTLVRNMHHSLRDQEGNLIPSEILSLLDLEGGLRAKYADTFNRAWAAVADK